MVYLQTTPYTTAASSLINILEMINTDYEGCVDDEFDIWLNSALLPTRASSIFGLGLVAKRKKIEPFIIVESEEYDFPDYRFYRYKKKDVDYAKISSDLYKKKAKKTKIPCEVKSIDLDLIKELLKNNYLIVRLNVKDIRGLKSNSSNYLVFKKYEEDVFTIIDPMQGELQIKEETVKSCLETLEVKKRRARKLIGFKRKLDY